MISDLTVFRENRSITKRLRCNPMRLQRSVCVASTVLLLFLLGVAVHGQSNSQAEDVDRLQLAGLAKGPAIVGGGVFFGEPSGVTAKLWYPETGFSLDALAAWSMTKDAHLYLHGSAIYHLALIETEGGRYITPYVGLGALFRFGEDPGIGVRLPVGLSLFLFPSFPLEIFGEISPGVGLYPTTNEEFGFGIGARFYLPLGNRVESDE